jgi:hypothetical protein
VLSTLGNEESLLYCTAHCTYIISRTYYISKILDLLLNISYLYFFLNVVYSPNSTINRHFFHQITMHFDLKLSLAKNKKHKKSDIGLYRRYKSYPIIFFLLSVLNF